MRFSLHAVAALAAARTLSSAMAEPCPKTGSEPPSVGTVVVSKDNPTQAWVVETNCDVRVLDIEGDNLFVDGVTTVQRIESVPTGIKNVVSIGAPLSQGGDFSKATWLEKIFIVRARDVDLAKLSLPTTLYQLSLIHSTVKSADKLNLPASLRHFDVFRTPISSLKSIKLPSRLSYLGYYGTQATSVDFQIPLTLELLYLNNNPITTLGSITFPDSLKHVGIGETQISTLRGVQWPKSLDTINLTAGATVVDFEIRESDLPIFNKAEPVAVYGTVAQTKCRDERAALTTTRSVTVCVISDERFNQLYRSATAPTPSSAIPSSRSSSSSGSKSSSSTRDGQGSNSGGFSELYPTRPGAGGGNNSDNSGGTGLGPKTGDNEIESDGTNNSAASPSSLNSTIVGIVVGSCVVVVLLVAATAYRIVSRKEKEKNEGTTTSLDPSQPYNSASTPGLSSAHASATHTPSTMIPNDVREDPMLIKFRIDANDIHLQKAIARGGHGVISKASWHGRPVAVKQMLPDSWHKDAVLASFMDEIRMCAQLDHPRVVTFVGISWTSLRDLSVVTEFMTGGDLHALLAKQPTPTHPHDWTQLWTSAGIKSKTAIALDIAEAIVYLHSFPRPILHRDLKSRNVLLDSEGNAKLSDFGISRVMAVDETMTSEVGTVAWIAPEVLRGQRYSERADVYSFGVVLVELDLCRHPYADISRQLGESSRLDAFHGTGVIDTLKNTQIAMAVSSGSLRPMPSRACPLSIERLVSRCVAFDPAMRPTAMEVAYELRQLLRHEAGLGRMQYE